MRLVGRPGGDLLSRVLRRSTMGAGGFHGRVRDGIGCGPPAKATRSSNRTKRRTPIGEWDGAAAGLVRDGRRLSAFSRQRGGLTTERGWPSAEACVLLPSLTSMRGVTASGDAIAEIEPVGRLGPVS